MGWPSLPWSTTGKDVAVGTPNTQGLRYVYVTIGQEYANAWMRLTRRLWKEELRLRGYHLSTHRNPPKAAQFEDNKPLYQALTHSTTKGSFILDMADRNHGLNLHQHRWKDQYDTVHVDESWFYLNRVDNSVTIIDGVTVPDAPTTQHKSP